MKYFSKPLVLALFFLSASSFADILTDIDVKQNADHLLVSTQINATTNQSFNLQKEARIIQTRHAVVTDLADGSKNLKISAHTTAFVSYELIVDLTKVNYFIEDQNWYPRVETEEPQTFNLSAKTENGFEIIHSAIGKSPQGVSMVFGVFKKYLGPSGKMKVYLQKQDDALADTLILNLEKYLKIYEEKIGVYPYEDFSVVESSDEVGYAFPRMTWIGSQLLRFPFILTTSIPHELLHSWWGNGVFVDYSTGNWCEGLTAYGADYGLLDQESRLVYRRRILTEYADYVKNRSEISLAQFVSRGEDRALQAIGYGKSTMMFLMLEDLVGSDAFNQSLKSFYQKFKFKKASYRDFFSEVQSHTKIQADVLNHFYDQWILKVGAVSWNDLQAATTEFKPQKSIVKIKMSEADTELLKSQTIDLSFRFQDGSAVAKKVNLQAESNFEFDAKPVSYTIDSEFKIFRQLAEKERPLNFSRVFGSASAEIVAQEETVTVLNQVFSQIQFQKRSSASEIDLNQSGVVLFENYTGGNKNLDQALQKAGVTIQPDQITLKNEVLSLANNSYFISIPVGNKIFIFFQLNSSLPVKRWFERWSHYGAQSYIVLTPTAALRQGLISSVFERPL